MEDREALRAREVARLEQLAVTLARYAESHPRERRRACSRLRRIVGLHARLTGRWNDATTPASD